MANITEDSNKQVEDFKLRLQELGLNYSPGYTSGNNSSNWEIKHGPPAQQEQPDYNFPARSTSHPLNIGAGDQVPYWGGGGSGIPLAGVPAAMPRVTVVGMRATDILTNILLTMNKQFETEKGTSPNITYNFIEEQDGNHIMELYCIKPDGRKLVLYGVQTIMSVGDVKETLSLMMINLVISGALSNIVKVEFGDDYEI